MNTKGENDLILNHDCVRSILLTLESYSYNYECSIKQLYTDIPDFSKDDIQYCLLKLHEAHYIKANVLKADGTFPFINTIYDITFLGHEYLNSIREPELWKKTKTIAAKIGATSISAITQISSGIVTSLIKSTLGL